MGVGMWGPEVEEWEERPECSAAGGGGLAGGEGWPPWTLLLR